MSALVLHDGKSNTIASVQECLDANIKKIVTLLVEADDDKDIAALSGDSLDLIVISQLPLTNVKTESLLASMVKLLKAGGKVVVKKVDDATTTVSSLTISGLVNALVTGDNIACSKPAWTVGDAAPLKFTRKAKAPAASTSAPAVNKKVMVDLQSDYNDIVLTADNLVDEDELLAADKAPEKIVSDCTTKKRACANCVCGRKELEELEEKAKTNTLTLDKAAGCGNCSKGDAFRCGGCPFLGKPALKAGEEKLILNLSVSDL